MKILFYCDTVFGFGGVQRVLAVVAQALARDNEVTILSTDTAENLSMYGYDKSNVKFRYVSYGDNRGLERLVCKACSFAYKYLLPRNAATARLYHNSFFRPTMKRKLVAAIGNDQDVVIGVHAYLSMQLASVATRINAKTIGWMHNSYEAFFEKENPYLPRLKDFFTHEMKRLDKIVVLCNTDAEKYRNRLGLSPIAIYNPLTLEPRGKGSPSYKRFISVGRFEGGHKGFDILLKAFAKFAKSNSEWTLEIVGEGPEESLCRKIIADNDLASRVTISPFTTDIQSHYANASVYILSSRWEGMPLVLVEAMAHGLSIVASDLPVTIEILDGKGVATLFRNGDIDDLAEKLQAIANSSELANMSDNAINYAKSFNVNEIIKTWKSLL